MKKYIFIINHETLGSFESLPVEGDLTGFYNLKNILKQSDSSFTMDSKDGKVIFRPEILNKSIIIIKEVS